MSGGLTNAYILIDIISSNTVSKNANNDNNFI
jgi:hypothetical protein